MVVAVFDVIKYRKIQNYQFLCPERGVLNDLAIRYNDFQTNDALDAKKGEGPPPERRKADSAS